MVDLIFNLRNIDFNNTLGVTSYVCNLAKALARAHSVYAVVGSVEDFQNSEWSSLSENVFAKVVEPINGVKEIGVKRTAAAIEILPHHFQARDFCRKSITICHDLHIFTIPWKYSDLKSKRARFRENMLTADAVMTHFPWTYFNLERYIEEPLHNLYLTPSPLMLDPRGAQEEVRNLPRTEKLLLYPAQLQRHKGHIALLEGLREAISDGLDVGLVLTGSEFEASHSQEILGRINACSLQSRVAMLGRVPAAQLRYLYSRCDGLIIPSEAEGGAYVALEGISSGSMVAVNRIEQAVSHLNAVGANVHWFDTGDFGSIAGAVRWLVAGGADVSGDGNDLARSNIEKMTWDRVAGCWEPVVQYVAEGGHRPIQSMDAFASNLEIHQ